VIASSQLDGRPAWSNDGTSIAFVSDRGGDRELWLARGDGSGARRLTSFRRAPVNAPSWSPDDRRIAFEVVIENQSRVAIVNVASGEVSLLTPPGPHERAPSWSSDGSRLYVSRLDDGVWRIVGRPIAGGPITWLTDGPGFGAMESPDAEALLYSRVTAGRAELWRLPLTGDPEERLYLRLPGRALAWTVRRRGIYYCYHRDERAENFVLAFRAFAANDEAIVLQTTSRSGVSFDVSSDERAVVFDRAERSESDILGLRRM
jgi:Tol biopolymer transport system component